MHRIALRSSVRAAAALAVAPKTTILILPGSRLYATAKPAASEISSILESRISGTPIGGNVEETDRALSVGNGIGEPFNISKVLRLIRSQPSQYIVASLAGRQYLLTPCDVLTIPRLRNVKVGDVLALNELHEIGSREYTLRGNPCIPPSRVRVSATILEHTKGSMELIFKKKRRKGYQKTIQHKQPYTRVRIGPIQTLGNGTVAEQS